MQNDISKFKIEFKKRLYHFVLKLINFINKLAKSPSNDVIGKQLLRSGTSVIANYIEAHAASSRRDFTNFFTHSLKSANESKVWLALLRDTNVDGSQEAKALLQETAEIANIIATSILTLKGKK